MDFSGDSIDKGGRVVAGMERKRQLFEKQVVVRSWCQVLGNDGNTSVEKMELNLKLSLTTSVKHLRKFAP